MMQFVTQGLNKLVSKSIIIGDSANKNEEPAQNETKLVQLEMRMEARIIQLETKMQNMFHHLQNFPSNLNDTYN